MDKPVDTDLQKENENYLRKMKQNEFSSVIDQIEYEYKLCDDASRNWRKKQFLMLELYNNQKRDPDKVGVPMLFSIVQTLLAAFYDDQMVVEFQAVEKGDYGIEENINPTAEYDARKMRKYALDLFWNWDTLMSGHGIIELSHFDYDLRLPVGQNQDYLTFMKDPFASSILGDLQGRDAVRFCGSPLRITKMRLNKIIENAKKTSTNEYFDLEGLAYAADEEDLVREARRERNKALNMSETAQDMQRLGDNGEYSFLQWCTYWKGKLHRFWLYKANDRSPAKIVRAKELGRMPYVDRILYPDSRRWDCVSVPDITEDKQRMNAVILNLIQEGLKNDLYPRTLFNKNLFDRDQVLGQLEFQQYIPVDGNPNAATATLAKNQINLGIADYILNTIDLSAQKANATPDIQQGVASKRATTLGELNMVAAKVDTRYGLNVKVFGWSEAEFWGLWYYMYVTYFPDFIKEKSIRINGAFAPDFRKLSKKDLIFTGDFDLLITSRSLNDVKRMKDLQSFLQYSQFLLQDPNANRRAIMKHLGTLHRIPRKEIDVFLPPTADEIIAKKENEELSKGNYVPVKKSDNHIIHLTENALAEDTPERNAHLQAHLAMIAMMKEQPDLFPEAQQQQGINQIANENISKELMSRQSDDPASEDLLRRRDARQQLAA